MSPTYHDDNDTKMIVLRQSQKRCCTTVFGKLAKQTASMFSADPPVSSITKQFSCALCPWARAAFTTSGQLLHLDHVCIYHMNKKSAYVARGHDFQPRRLPPESRNTGVPQVMSDLLRAHARKPWSKQVASFWAHGRMRTPWEDWRKHCFAIAFPSGDHERKPNSSAFVFRAAAAHDGTAAAVGRPWTSVCGCT